jgi:hypothetical protein
MRCRAAQMALIAVALATSGIAGEARARKPRLEVRTTVRVALAPVQVMAVAELVGGEDLEEFYCTGLEWDWGDGNLSFQESDCDPYEPGMEVDRFFSARHVYGAPGEYRVRVRLRRAGQDVASARTQVVIPGGSLARAW